MSDFFLLNAAIDLNNLISFKQGMSELLTIEKQENHFFKKHISIWNLAIITELFESYGQTEQAIIKFIEQLTNFDSLIDTEFNAEKIVGKDNYGFLGVDFSKTTISLFNQIVNDICYKNWIYIRLSNAEKLKIVLKRATFLGGFEKDYNSLSKNVQESIIEEFKKAKSRGLTTPFAPDTKIIKDVSPDNYKSKVMELRVYAPQALRVYFNEINGDINVASIELKSSPDQTADIKSAHKILTRINTK